MVACACARPDSRKLDALYQQAMSADQDGDFSAVVKIFKKINGLTPRDASTMNNLGKKARFPICRVMVDAVLMVRQQLQNSAKTCSYACRSKRNIRPNSMIVCIYLHSYGLNAILSPIARTNSPICRPSLSHYHIEITDVCSCACIPRLWPHDPIHWIDMLLFYALYVPVFAWTSESSD